MARRRARCLCLAMATVGALGLAGAAGAGTGRFLSKWMSHAPSIDGQSTQTDWTGAEIGTIGGSLALAIGNDARTLYIGVFDGFNASVGPGDFVRIDFDDEGGAAPVHDDGAWLNSGCQLLPAAGEGNMAFAADGAVSYQEMVTPFTGCSSILIPGRTRFAAGNSVQGSIFEIAIPLDGPAPLQLLAGERFGIRIQVYRDGVNVACFPECGAGPLPEDFRNLVLASGGCNTGGQNLDAGLPLDWTPDQTLAGNGGWRASGGNGDPVFCDQPEQGPGGSAACVTEWAYPGGVAASTLYAPLPVSGFTTATIRFLGTLVQGEPNAYLYFLTYSHGLLINGPVSWLSNHWAETVTVDLALDQPPFDGGNEPDQIAWHHGTAAGGVEGGYAQVDDYELRCGPVLFADGFQSGLTTHWSETTP